MRAALLAALLPLIACGNRPDAAAPDPSAAAPTASAPAGAAPSAPAAEAPPAEPAASAEPPRRRRPLPIHSSCTDVVTLVFGDDPKATGAGRRTLTEDSTIDGPRDDKGNMTIWLLDPKGEPIVKVDVTRGMKKVEVGRSCRTLDAR
jgi:hypothetical protein